MPNYLKIELAYIAGIFDGEGTIGIYKKKNRYFNVVVALGMANEYIPTLLKFHFGGSTHKQKLREQRQQQWRWTITSLGAISFLEAIKPYLKLKRNEADLAIQFQKGLFFKGRAAISSEELALREAQKVLMAQLKIKQ